MEHKFQTEPQLRNSFTSSEETKIEDSNIAVTAIR